jgi:hypothetical protein
LRERLDEGRWKKCEREGEAQVPSLTSEPDPLHSLPSGDLNIDFYLRKYQPNSAPLDEQAVKKRIARLLYRAAQCTQVRRMLDTSLARGGVSQIQPLWGIFSPLNRTGGPTTKLNMSTSHLYRIANFRWYCSDTTEEYSVRVSDSSRNLRKRLIFVRV